MRLATKILILFVILAISLELTNAKRRGGGMLFKKYILMPYPCSQFCADVKFDIRFDNRFDIKLGDSFHVNHTINFGTKLRSYGIV